jgi:hypothetical protein
VLRGVTLFPTRPCFVGVFGVVFKIDDIDPNADRLKGDDDTIFQIRYNSTQKSSEMQQRESRDGNLSIARINNNDRLTREDTTIKEWIVW